MLLSGGRVRSLGRQRPATLTALNSDYPSTPTSTLPFAADSSNIHLVDNLPSPPSPSSPKLQGLVLLSSSSPPATLSLLRQSAWVIGRQIEMMSVLLGYEQANKYVIRDGHGNVLGYICEEAQSIRGTILRQVLVSLASLALVLKRLPQHFFS